MVFLPLAHFLVVELGMFWLYVYGRWERDRQEMFKIIEQAAYQQASNNTHSSSIYDEALCIRSNVKTKILIHFSSPKEFEDALRKECAIDLEGDFKRAFDDSNNTWDVIKKSISSWLFPLLMLVYCLAQFFMSGSATLTSGVYLQFTWDLEDSNIYKILIALLVLDVFGLFGIILYFFNAKAVLLNLPLNAGLDLLPIRILQIFALYKMAFQKKIPEFAWHSQEFGEIEFESRTWKNIFRFESNDTFGQALTEALRCAHIGQKKKLKKLLGVGLLLRMFQSDEQADRVMAICNGKLPPPIDEGGTSESSVD